MLVHVDVFVLLVVQSDMVMLMSDQARSLMDNNDMSMWECVHDDVAVLMVAMNSNDVPLDLLM